MTVATWVLALIISSPALAQDAPPSSVVKSSACTREDALTIVEQQIDLTEIFDDDVRRIAVLLRAADIIWPHEQDKARTAFTEAFEIAVRNFKEQGDKTIREGRLQVQLPDQRFTVITAIARRDSAWARKLSNQAQEEDAKAAEESAAKDSRQDARIGEKLLSAAYALVTSDQATALVFARNSLRYPATIQLPAFIYKLSEINRAAADEFYREALVAYARAPMERFLYLSSYPFGSDREVGEMPIWSTYVVPSGFMPNQVLQRLFVQTLLNRARELIQNPPAAVAGARFSEAQQIVLALSRLDAQVAKSLPDLSLALQDLRGNIFALLSQSEQANVSDTLTVPPKKSFDETIEQADRMANADRRESAIALAILNAADSESLEKIEAAAAKIDDVNLRSQLLSRVYFNRAQRATKDKKLGEARRLAARVDELDQRAFLYSQIASESIKQTKDDTEARELLESVLDAVGKAPNTEIKARASIAVAYLYRKIDPNRALAVLSDAVKTINRLESADFSQERVRKRIEGKAFGFYTTIQTAGFSLETTFREIATADFDGVLYLASNLADKPLRTLTTLALAEDCLKMSPVRPKVKPQKVVTMQP